MEKELSNNEQLNEIKKLFADNHKYLKKEIEDLRIQIKTRELELKVTVERLEQQNSELQNKVEILERKARKNNLVVFGLTNPNLTNKPLATWTATQIKSLLGIDLSNTDIGNVFFKNNLLIIEFTSYICKLTVLKNAYKLKGKKISIAEDLSRKDQEINKVLVANLKQAKEKKLKAYIRNYQLHIGDEVFKYEDLVERDKTHPTDKPDLFSSPPAPRRVSSAPGTPTIESSPKNDIVPGKLQKDNSTNSVPSNTSTSSTSILRHTEQQQLESSSSSNTPASATESKTNCKSVITASSTHVVRKTRLASSDHSSPSSGNYGQQRASVRLSTKRI